MKTNIKIIAISILSSFAFFATAQDKIDDKHFSTSFVWKDVTKFSNKDSFTKRGITIKSVGYPEWVITKGVLKSRNVNKSEAAGNMISKGYPDWIISKGVARLNK